jgi:hypothetical protein
VQGRVDMLTILFMSDQTAAVWKKYQSLFAPFLMRQDIFICNWNTSGTDVASAVPELYELIRGKEHWRAVIITLADEYEAGEFPSNEHNPFDFSAWEDLSAQRKESQIPLIRLIHMLGDVPPLKVNFKEEPVVERKEPDSSLAFTSEHDPEEVRTAHEELRCKYTFDEIRPEEIIICATKTEHEDKEKHKITNSWSNYMESQSSNFWERNAYPDPCRFVMQEIVQSRSFYFTRDMFNFWTTVICLSINDIPPNTLQAYRVYTMGVELKNEELRRTLHLQHRKYSQFLKKMKEMRPSEESIRDLSELELWKEEAVPIVSTHGASDKLYVKEDPEMNDYQWTEQVQRSKNELHLCLKSLHRVINKASQQAKHKANRPLPLTMELESEQIEDLQAQLQTQEEQLLTYQLQGGRNFEPMQEQLEQTHRAVKNQIHNRFNRKMTLMIGSLALLVCLLGWVPLFVRPDTTLSAGDWTWALLVMCGFLVVVVLGGWFSLRRLKLRLQRLMHEYNHILIDLIQQSQSKIQSYERYLSHLMMVLRGKKIMNKLKADMFSMLDAEQLQKRHLFRLNQEIQTIQHWMDVFHLSKEITGESIPAVLNTEIPPETNPEYLFAIYNKPNTLQLNDTGESLQAPYSFVSKIKIRREEIYE